MFSCGGKNDQIETSPDINNSPDLNNGENGNNYDLSQDSAVEKNMPEIIEDLRMDIKKMKAELDYQHENLSKLEAQTQVWANPFAIYNKEVVLNNGSSIFGKIVYQDQDVMKIETLIGQLIIDRNTIIRVVNQVNAYGNFDNESSDNQSGNSPDPSGVNLIQKRVTNMSAHLVLVGDITEEKDGSGNTVLSGEVKNVGNKRADFSKIIFTFRTNWQGDSKALTAFINGVTNTFETGISSDNSILPHAVGNFQMVIPKSFGSFIGYSYDIDWSQYDG
ncbi:uncharacterized protein METZ01_LOCUS139809 [marine metagenome]|jgi:hypothetical protein|uniref:Uncharacterized protein n=1 Tax=marine metagenome TaxID=408172 RepID=A0A381ZCB8_9ZZZZ|tara:strand:+ start:127 stop:954 length:828 start_codon:yes stop_codon:yes gene_type:complete